MGGREGEEQGEGERRREELKMEFKNIRKGEEREREG